MRRRNKNYAVLPNNCFYSIFIKNKQDLPAQCFIAIDNQDMGVFYLEPKSSYSIDRPTHSASRFMFVEDRSNLRNRDKSSKKEDDVIGSVVILKFVSCAINRDAMVSKERKKTKRRIMQSSSIYSEKEFDDFVDNQSEEEEVEENFVSGGTTLTGHSELNVTQSLSRVIEDAEGTFLTIYLVGKK
eukprot:TRINITY_DN10679_c0_g1_i1.p1 TRINITY_DN10679_c0_g1~~TRINITY_DN10679_c0_g1_i1.p1  ORF type:complete len:185 (+),score=18.69 TRINITY_DN10679_c0_g1_i1:125-679(+)